MLESEAKRLIEEVRSYPIRTYLPDPAILDRREIVNGIGQKIPEPARMYVQRVDVQMIKFIVDKAIFDAGLQLEGDCKPTCRLVMRRRRPMLGCVGFRRCCASGRPGLMVLVAYAVRT